MPPYHGSTDPPRTLTARLRRLNDNLQELGERLRASIVAIVGETISETIRDALRRLLRAREMPTEPYRDYRDRSPTRDYRGRADDPWSEDEPRWSDEEDHYVRHREGVVQRSDAPQRWGNAMSAALQTALWFVKQQPKRRPVLTTLAVTLAAGITAFVAGPVFAAGAGVVASIAGLLVTADATKSAAEIAAG
jgi:hypothetical protein